MKKGINIPHLFKEVDLLQKLLLIKQAGFDICMPTLDPLHEVINYPIENAVSYAKQIGLKLDYGHAPYKEPDINAFWTNTKEGDEIERIYEDTINVASYNGIKTIICHLHCGTSNELNEVGLKRLERLANYAEQKNVIIAIENLYSYIEPDFIFNNINHSNLKMCFDSGHENFLTPNANFLNKFNNKIVAVHLHDNDGVKDQHKTIFTGTINWEVVATKLAKIKNVELTLEVKNAPKTTTAFQQEEELKQVLKTEFEALLKFEKLIEDEKVKLEKYEYEYKKN